MPIRSMTGFAQVRSGAEGAANGHPAFTLSLKSVNHRYLDLQMRMPSETDGLEMKLRRLLKEKINRGHVDLTLSIERATANGMQLNRELVNGYIQEFRTAAKEFSVDQSPDLNAILRMPGALSSAGFVIDEALENSVLERAGEAITKLNEMRSEEGRGLDSELRHRMDSLAKVTGEVEKMRAAVSKAYFDKVQTRMNELIAGKADSERILQEAAMLAERSDIEEEIVRLKSHVKHFIQMLDGGGEVGKKLDFLLQEMNREANTLLSKTAGVAGDGMRITELGLAMKSEIEKSREQVQNIE
jgi:uncharacterized protein (TIGR00255 family)